MLFAWNWIDILLRKCNRICCRIPMFWVVFKCLSVSLLKAYWHTRHQSMPQAMIYSHELLFIFHSLCGALWHILIHFTNTNTWLQSAGVVYTPHSIQDGMENVNLLKYFKIFFSGDIHMTINTINFCWRYVFDVMWIKNTRIQVFFRCIIKSFNI